LKRPSRGTYLDSARLGQLQQILNRGNIEPARSAQSRGGLIRFKRIVGIDQVLQLRNGSGDQ
jgi:hypothetical protein